MHSNTCLLHTTGTRVPKVQHSRLFRRRSDWTDYGCESKWCDQQSRCLGMQFIHHSLRKGCLSPNQEYQRVGWWDPKADGRDLWRWVTGLVVQSVWNVGRDGQHLSRGSSEHPVSGVHFTWKQGSDGRETSSWVLQNKHQKMSCPLLSVRWSQPATNECCWIQQTGSGIPTGLRWLRTHITNKPFTHVCDLL